MSVAQTYRSVIACARDIQPGDLVWTGTRDAVVIERTFLRGGTVVEIHHEDGFIKLSPVTRVYSYRRD